MISKKLFVKGLNTDDSHLIVDTNEYVGALNVRFATSENGNVGEITNIEGNVEKSQTIGGAWALPGGTNTTIGAYEDTPNRRVFFFNKNSNGDHGIYCYDADTNLVYTVLLNSQVTGGLAFTSDIHSVAMIGNLLYWTDNNKPQRRINVEAAMRMNHPLYATDVAAYSNPVSQDVISLIRNPPMLPLSVAKAIDNTYPNNLIAKEVMQFAYRFVYRDYENSVLSSFSEFLNYNTSTDLFNAVDVSIPLAQKIEQDVIRVEFAVKYMFGGKMSIIKVLDREKEPNAFTNHNNGTAYGFRFFNDSVGIAIDDATSVKQFDAIPIRSGTLEIAKSRLFLGDNYDGYQAPVTSSLTVSAISQGGGTLEGTWVRITYNNPLGGTGSIYLIDITGITTNPGYYEPGTQPTPPLPTTVDYTTLTYRGAGLSNVLSYLGITYSNLISVQIGPSKATITNGPAISTINNKPAFKSDSTYRLGVVFYDEAGRKCGVVTSDATKITTPDRTFSNVSYVTGINWGLSNANALSQIPEWAKYYSIVMTKNLRTSFFVQMKAKNLTYIKRDAATNEFITDNTYSETHYGIGVNINSLEAYGLGYVYNEGDLCKLYDNTGNIRTLRVKATFGDYVIVDLFNYGSLASSAGNYLFEIYTPYVGNFDEAYFERGQVYPVTNAGLGNRAYSVLSGSIGGDITILDRSLSAVSYNAEAMSPSDLMWKYWNVNIGRPNFVLSIRPVHKRTSVYYSNVVVLGSQTNGLSTFDVLDQTQLPVELSTIKKLQLVSKVESEGTVMLAIGEQETASVYLGETQVFDNAGTSFLAKSSGVIGNINVMRGGFGTINPESVARYMGQVYWFDANRGAVVRYDTNGIYPISNNKMFKYFRKIGKDVLNGNLKFFGGVDPYHNEVLMFAPRKTVVPQNTILTDMEYESSVYPFLMVPPPTPTPEPTPTPTPTPEPTPEPTPTPTPEPTPTPTPEPTPTPTPEPTPTPTPTPTPLPGIGFGIYTGANYVNSGAACASGQYPDTTIYLNADSVPEVNDVFFTDQACTPGSYFNGNSFWYIVRKDANVWAIYINSVGAILDIVDCNAPVPTPTPTPTPPPPPPTCTSYSIENNGGVAITWIGQACADGSPVGGTVNPGQTELTGCLIDGSFSYGDNGSVIVNSSPC